MPALLVSGSASPQSFLQFVKILPEFCFLTCVVPGFSSCQALSWQGLPSWDWNSLPCGFSSPMGLSLEGFAVVYRPFLFVWEPRSSPLCNLAEAALLPGSLDSQVRQWACLQWAGPAVSREGGPSMGFRSALG